MFFLYASFLLSIRLLCLQLLSLFIDFTDSAFRVVFGNRVIGECSDAVNVSVSSHFSCLLMTQAIGNTCVVLLLCLNR